MSADWSRPRMQRQELGPVLHDVGHTIYSAAEDLLLADTNEYGLELTPPTNLKELAAFGGVLMEAVDYCATDVVAEVPSDLMDDFISAQSQITVMSGGKALPRELTFSYRFRGALDEGLESGVVAPLQLYRTLKLAEDGRILHLAGAEEPPEFELEFEASDIARRITTVEFQTMLHQLAMGPNGSLGTSANRLRELRAEDRTTFAVVAKYGWERSFVLDEQRNITGLTPNLLAYIRREQTANRAAHSSRADSGGCPVRHATYKKLGDTAQQYFEQLGTPDARPRFEGESLITRASRFVSSTLLRSIEGAAA